MEINIISFDENGATQELKVTPPALPKWTMADAIGYTPQTTFWDDFSIADLYGPEAIVDTLNRAWKEWKDDVKYIAELSLVLNHKGCWWYNAAEALPDKPALRALSELYFALWEKLHDWAKAYFTGNDANYYFRVTD